MTTFNLAQASLSGNYQRQAIYFTDSDCVEYVKEDVFVIYERVDDFLTLIFDETKLNVIGFKLKGFRHYFSQIRDKVNLLEDHFVLLVEVIEAHFTEIGEGIFHDDCGDWPRRAYKAAGNLAAGDNVMLQDTAELAA